MPKKQTTKTAAQPPVEKESANDRKKRLKQLLLQKRAEILKEGKAEFKKYLSGENKQLVETAMFDEGDISVVDLAEDITLKQLSNNRDMLIKIDIALQKLEADTYGICEDCGDEISEERLKIMPFAILCRDCQEKQEVMEKLEKEEF